jgi:hypothetical protein
MGPKANKKARQRGKSKKKKGKRAHSGLDQKEMNTTGTNTTVSTLKENGNWLSEGFALIGVHRSLDR